MLDEEVPEREGGKKKRSGRGVEELLYSKGTNGEHVSEVEVLLFLVRVCRRWHLG